MIHQVYKHQSGAFNDNLSIGSSNDSNSGDANAFAHERIGDIVLTRSGS